MTDEAARAGEQTARAGADIANRGTETARNTVESGLNTATQTFQRVSDQFTKVLGFSGPRAEGLARRSCENVQAVAQAWGASAAAIPTCSSCGSRACGRRLECRSRMRRESHVRFWEGGGGQVPSATRLVVGFEHEADARRFRDAMRARLEEFALTLHPDKTRLIAFGRFAADRRAQRGLGKPETFCFLGFTHICGRSRRGTFQLQRKSRADRMRATLRRVKDALRRRMHQPIPVQGRWLRQVVNGYFAYHAVPTNRRALMAFRHHVTDLWRRTLRRRSQKDRFTWARMATVADAWLPRPHLLHPWPSERFAVRHPRWEPSARIGPARICAGGAQ